MFSLYIIVTLVISHSDFQGGTLVLIASVPGHGFSFTNCNLYTCYLSSIVQLVFYFMSFYISRDILRNQKILWF